MSLKPGNWIILENSLLLFVRANHWNLWIGLRSLLQSFKDVSTGLLLVKEAYGCSFFENTPIWPKVNPLY